MIKNLKFLFILLIGPFITYTLYYIGENDPNLFALTIQVSIMIAISIVIAVATQVAIKKTFLSVLVSTVLSVLGFVIFLYLYCYFIVNDKEKAEWIMWLPVARLFLIIYGLPTALSVSYAILKTYRKIDSSLSIK